MAALPHLTIIGGGPSGLAAAYEAVKAGARATVIERLDQVGGLARTTEQDGNRYDVGPHRFFTRNAEVRDFFIEIAGADLIRVPRLTRILYRRHFFNYPLTPLNALFGVGPLDGLRILVSYGAARIRHRLAKPRLATFEDWVVDRFGRRLFEIFFKTYTEKVWGVASDRIGADWAAQRIKGLSLGVAVLHALFRRKPAAKTLVDEFLYLRQGAGQLYRNLVRRFNDRDLELRLGHTVEKIRHDGRRVTAVVTRDPDGRVDMRAVDEVLSSATLTELLEMLEPAPPPAIMEACRALRYRTHICVNLAVTGNPFPDNWIYVHAAEVRMARVANYRNFSIEMAVSPEITPITVEYFCFPGDDIWQMTDDALIALAKRELALTGIVPEGHTHTGFVLRSEKAYPVIEIGYRERIDRIRSWLGALENLRMIGRSGMFKYNNQDHAIATGLLAARTALGLGRYDPWLINIDAEYHEAGAAS
jgi:protoporphyrinogen oxidase